MEVYVGVGSNIKADANVIKALVRLRRYVDITGVSTFYETVPERNMRQTNYINGVLRVETKYRPKKLRRILKRIERGIGRRHPRGTDSYASRPIDLDIILYGDQVIKTKKLDIPDRHIFKRPYISVPLAELDPGLVVPESDASIGTVAASAQTDRMRVLKGITSEIRRFLHHE